jgi:hypothetical protein
VAQVKAPGTIDVAGVDWILSTVPTTWVTPTPTGHVATQTPDASEVQLAANDWPPGVMVIRKITMAPATGVFPGLALTVRFNVMTRVPELKVLAATFQAAVPAGGAVVDDVGGGAVVVVVLAGTVEVVVVMALI